MSRLHGTRNERSEKLEQDLNGWAEDVISKWKSKMESLGMLTGKNNTGLLARSLTHTIIWESRNANNIEYLHRIRFAFNYYGKMVDYGLGKGTDINDRFHFGRNAATNKRKRKEWIWEPWYNMQPVLKHLLRTRVQEQLKIMIKNNFESLDGKPLDRHGQFGSSLDTFFNTKIND